jgi:hypothetical protein
MSPGGSSPATPSRGSSPVSRPQLGEDLTATPPQSSPHTYQRRAQVDWLKDMKKNYKTAVIEKCSRKVQEAVENNTDISDIREKKEVRNSIINETVGCLLDIFGGVGKPAVAQMRELVSEMGFHYPAMFKEDDTGFGYGLGGCKGISGLPNQMLDRYRSRMAEMKKKTTFEEAGVVLDVATEKKKGKKKLIYGRVNWCFLLHTMI